MILGWDYMNNAWNEWVLAYGPERQKEWLSGLGFGPVDWQGMVLAMMAALTSVGLIVMGLQMLNRRVITDPVTLAYQPYAPSWPVRVWCGPTMKDRWRSPNG